MLLLSTEKARAVYFFDQAEIVGQLLLPEFESMLDGFVPSKEWALRTMQAAYVEINHRLLITAAVFLKWGLMITAGSTAPGICHLRIWPNAAKQAQTWAQAPFTWQASANAPLIYINNCFGIRKSKGGKII